jgi:hypothetical protein
MKPVKIALSPAGMTIPYGGCYTTIRPSNSRRWSAKSARAKLAIRAPSEEGEAAS